MAVPKRKTTRSRTGKRRSHIKTGFYKGRQVLDPKE